MNFLFSCSPEDDSKIELKHCITSRISVNEHTVPSILNTTDFFPVLVSGQPQNRTSSRQVRSAQYSRIQKQRMRKRCYSSNVSRHHKTFTHLRITRDDLSFSSVFNFSLLLLVRKRNLFSVVK